MDLSSGTHYWPTLGTDVEGFPDPGAGLLECDVAVVGAGITGALVAWTLVQEGYRVAVIDRARPGFGSTVASTALVQYEPDVTLSELSNTIGWDDASSVYRRCIAAVDRLGTIVESLDYPCGFRRASSLYIAKVGGLDSLEHECHLRRRAGIDVRWVDKEELERSWGIRRPGAILSASGAEVDPLALTYQLLKAASSRGASMVINAGSVRWPLEGDRFLIPTAAGPPVSAQRVIVATGYEAQSVLHEKIVDLDSTFAIATAPLSNAEPWPGRALLWEDDEPYLYARTLNDGRLLIGGEDEPFSSPELRDALIGAKANRITEKFRALLPRLDVRPRYAWAGTFGTTRDGLGYAGESPEHPGVLFALGLGGNGMTFAVMIAGFLADVLRDRPPPEFSLFRFGR